MRHNRHWYGVSLLTAGAFLLITATFGLGADKGATEETSAATPGAVVVETFKTTATIDKIDSEKRKVTLVAPDGKKTTYKAGPEVANFDQLKVGDKVTAVLTEEVAVFMGPEGAQPSASGATKVALAPKGAKPGGVMVDSRQMTVKVKDVDTKKRKVTLELPDGSSKKVKVGEKVDLASVKPGDTVTAQVSEGLAVTVDSQ